jgi:zinc protease
VPLIAINFAIRGGANQDPIDKPGLANMAMSLLTQGAGDLDSRAFQDRLERKAIEISFSATRDYVRGTMRMLKENREEATELLRLALTAPRFDTDAIERTRAQIVSTLKREAVTPNNIAYLRWWETAFPGHPYGQPIKGTPDSLARIGVDDLKTFVAHGLARNTLKVAIVGDVDPQTAGLMLDRIFGALPARSELVPVVTAAPHGLGRRIVIPLDVPQTVVTFGGPGIARSDPDFIAAYIVNHILGGGSFSSRLYQEVREKRGLAYSVSNGLYWFEHSAVFYGATATQAARTGETIAVIESEIRRLAASGPTQEELDKAKSYLKGSFALSLDTSSKVANMLVQIQLDNLGIDYIERRGHLIDAVTLDDARRVAKRLLDGGLLVTVVGKPQGVMPKPTE